MVGRAWRARPTFLSVVARRSADVPVQAGGQLGAGRLGAVPERLVGRVDLSRRRRGEVHLGRGVGQADGDRRVLVGTSQRRERHAVADGVDRDPHDVVAHGEVGEHAVADDVGDGPDDLERGRGGLDTGQEGRLGVLQLVDPGDELGLGLVSHDGSPSGVVLTLRNCESPMSRPIGRRGTQHS